MQWDNVSDSSSNRRDFLAGRAVRRAVESAGSRLADQFIEREIPSRGPTLMLRTTAMACDFDVVLNPGQVDTNDGGGARFHNDSSISVSGTSGETSVNLPTPNQLDAASTALELVHELEQQLSVYRSNSELTLLNQQAFQQPVVASPELFELLVRGQQLSELTRGAFDPAAGALVNLWRRCRQEYRIPTALEIEATLPCCGVRQVRFDETDRTVALIREGIEFNLGAIGKGYAVDRVGETLLSVGVSNWLVHGGRSSIRANGTHAGHDGWPIGLRSPLMPDKPFATLLLKDAAIGTSGTAVQWFRHEGKRYGHILDPRSGWPVESLLSVSVIAPDAAMADALSTAFFVLGVEKSLECCDNLPPAVSAVFFPLPTQGQSLQPILHNVSADRWFAN